MEHSIRRVKKNNVTTRNKFVLFHDFHMVKAFDLRSHEALFCTTGTKL